MLEKSAQRLEKESPAAQNGKSLLSQNPLINLRFPVYDRPTLPTLTPDDQRTFDQGHSFTVN
jgi:hypothetical protein